MWRTARKQRLLVLTVGSLIAFLLLLLRQGSSPSDRSAHEATPPQPRATEPLGPSRTPVHTRAVIDVQGKPVKRIVLAPSSSSLPWRHVPQDDINPWWNNTNKKAVSHSSDGLSICDFGFGILTSPRFINSRLRDVTRSWVRRLCQEEDNFFFVSNETLPAFAHPTMVTNCSDAYEQLCCKSVQNVFLLHTALPGKKWYMKVDDDTLVVPKHLVDELSIYDHREALLIGCPYFLILNSRTLKQRIWGRPLLPWGSQPGDHIGPVEANLMYVSGGSGYVWSQGLMERLVTNLSLINDFCVRTTFEDVGFGLAARAVGGRIIGHRGFFVDPPEKHMTSADFEVLPLTYHLAHNTTLMPLFDAMLHVEEDVVRRRELGRDWEAVQRQFPNVMPQYRRS